MSVYVSNFFAATETSNFHQQLAGGVADGRTCRCVYAARLSARKRDFVKSDLQSRRFSLRLWGLTSKLFGLLGKGSKIFPIHSSKIQPSGNKLPVPPALNAVVKCKFAKYSFIYRILS